MARIQIQPGTLVPIELTEAERAAVLERTLAGEDLTERLREAPLHDGTCTASYSLDELDDLRGYVAAEANHTEDMKLRRRLDRVFARLRTVMEAYDDGLWPE